jgi:HPt (histidine-containing phosphotransfer) domain-containing protein
LQQVFSGRFSQDERRGQQVVMTIARALVDTEIALANRLRHNGFIPPEVEAFDHLEGLVAATCNQLSQLQDQLQLPIDGQSLTACDEHLAAMVEALEFARLTREAAIVSAVLTWLRAANGSGAAVSNSPALRTLADALVWLTLYLERRLLDPVEDFTPLLVTAEQYASRLAAQVPSAPQLDPFPPELDEELEAAATPGETIPEELREVFLEESAEIIERLQALLPAWEVNAAKDEQLREIRRHFHTFKGNGNAVGLYTLAELGRDAQDMLDRVLESLEPVNTGLPALLRELVAALPELVATSGGAGDFNLATVRSLRSRCTGLR